MFTNGFSGTVYAGDKITCEVDGFTLTATIHADDNLDSPWTREDGHGTVSDWRASRDKQPGEMIVSTDGRFARFYDFAEAVKIARRDEWGAPDGTFRPDATPTRGQIAAAAAMADFKRLRDWCNDEWTYVGVSVTVAREGVQLVDDFQHALWGIESDCPEYLTEVANEYVDAALEDARAVIARLAA